MDGRQPPELADVFFGGVEGMYYGPQNTPMLWKFTIAGTKERPYTPSTPKKLHSQAWGKLTYSFKASAQSARPHVGARGPFLLVVAMVVVAVTRVVFCNKAT
jgi:hypothetical protein